MTIISVHSYEFIKPITKAITDGKELVIWHQFSAKGGLQEWLFLSNINNLDEIIKRGKPISAFTVYEWIKVPAENAVNEKWLSSVNNAYSKETTNYMLLIRLTEADKNNPKLDWVGELEDIKEFYDSHFGQNVEVGRVPSIFTREIVRGYFPDENGNLKTGIY